MDLIERADSALPGKIALLDCDIVAVVEGEDDIWFYENLCAEVAADTGLRVMVQTPTRLRGGAEDRNGKRSVLEIYRILEGHSFAPVFDGQKTRCIFICDK